MDANHEWLRDLLLMALRQIAGDRLVFAVPQGIAVLSTDGRHILIRIYDARLERA